MVAIAPETILPKLLLSAPAKLNLFLSILGPRDDGFHDLESLVIGVNLCDTLTASRTDDGQITIRCNRRELESPDNLVVRSAQRLQDAYAVSSGVAFHLEKSIPVGGGMGGGSSDAAAALRLCNELWSLGLSDVELRRHGASLGSDVPLFFALPGAVITGRGDVVQPAPLSWTGWVLLVSTPTPVSTPAVYRAWSQTPETTPAARWRDALLGAASAELIMEQSFNDLEHAVFEVAPQVRQVVDTLQTGHVGTFRVSGAGSTLFRLFDDEETARHTAGIIEDEFSNLTTKVVTAPVGVSPIRTQE